MINKDMIDTLIKNVKTPFYVFDIDVLKNRVAYLKKMMPANVTLCFAMKANPFIVRELGDVISKYEVCSPGEYKICDELAIPREKLVISGVYKDEESMRLMLSKEEKIGIFTIESVNQIELLDRLTKESNQNLDLLLRLTSGNQFGMTEEEVETIIRNKDKYEHLNIRGIQYFSGTQKTVVRRIEKEIEYLDNYIRHLNDDLGFKIAELEFGPGFPVEYFEGSNFDESAYLSEISSLISNMEYQGKITMELGRSIAASCGSYFTKVVDTKTNKEGNFALIDGGMHHLQYYGQMMAMKKPMLEVLPKRDSNITEDWNICGSLCTINDLVVKKLPVSNLKIGDIFMFENTGAYSMTEGISLFLSRDLPQVVFFKDKKIEVVRDHRNTYSLNMPKYEGREN